MSVSLAGDSSETVEVIIVNLATVTASDMHHVFTILTLIFVSVFFRNDSSNSHQLCCEDSPTKGLYDHCQSGDLDLHSRSQVHLKFNLRYLRQYFSYCIQTWNACRLMDARYAYARFDDLDLDARSQWVGKGNKISVPCSRQLSKQ